MNMKPAPKWAYSLSIGVTMIVGVIFYGVGLHHNDTNLTDAGSILIIMGLTYGIFCWKRDSQP